MEKPQVTIDADLAAKIQVLVLPFHHCIVRPASVVQLGAMREMEQYLSRKFAGTKPGSITELQDARKLFKLAGVDPTRTRPASEALFRRVMKGSHIPMINNAVDAGNLLSLSTLLPLGLYDLAKIQGSIELRLGKAGEGYPGMRKGDVHLEGRLGLFDELGAFGSPSSDSPRTCVSGSSRDLLVVMYGTRELPSSRLEDASKQAQKLFQLFVGGVLEGAEIEPVVSKS